MRKMQSKVLLLLTVLMLMVSQCSVIFATDLDSIANGDQSSPHQYGSSSPSSDDKSYNSITDYMQGYNYTTEEQMQKASTFASPITNAIGTITGFVVMITVALVGAVTALDLLYIAVPFTRSFLNPMQAQGGGGAPMGGMGMGMGMRGGMGMGGMGARGAQGGGGGEYGLHRKWVSDEAVACVNMANAQSQPQGGMGMGGGMGMMGGGMGMMGGGMGMMGGGQPQAQPQTKSVIMEYLKKRTVFLIVFAIALSLLLSSLFTDCGLNLAELLYKIVSKFNNGVASANI